MSHFWKERGYKLWQQRFLALPITRKYHDINKKEKATRCGPWHFQLWAIDHQVKPEMQWPQDVDHRKYTYLQDERARVNLRCHGWHMESSSSGESLPEVIIEVHTTPRMVESLQPIHRK